MNILSRFDVFAHLLYLFVRSYLVLIVVFNQFLDHIYIRLRLLCIPQRIVFD